MTEPAQALTDALTEVTPAMLAAVKGWGVSPVHPHLGLSPALATAIYIAMSAARTPPAESAERDAARRGVNYSRDGDMTAPGESVLTAHIQQDGDVCLQIRNRYGPDALAIRWADIEFCTSGGKSPNTVSALHALVTAMAADDIAGRKHG